MQRHQSIDFLKATLIVMIVGIHVGFLYDYSQVVGHVLNNGLFRVSVPVFFVINGYFFESVLRRNELSKWAKRIFLLYIIWTVLYAPYWLDLSNPLRTLIDGIFGYHHLWYISALLGAGFVLYVFRNLSTRVLLALSFTLFLVGLLIQYSGHYHFFQEIPLLDRIVGLNFTYRNFLFLGFPLLTTGYIVRREQLEQRIKRRTTIILLTFFGTLYGIESAILYVNFSGNVAFDVYLLSFFLCPLIFLLVLKSKFTVANFKTNLISPYCTAAYLIHPVFIINYTEWFAFDSITLLFVTLTSTIVSSFLILQVQKRFKYIV